MGAKQMNMDIQSIKINLIRWLTDLQDESVLEKLQAFKNQQEYELSDAHKKLLDERLASYENHPGQALNWEDVVKEIENDL